MKFTERQKMIIENCVRMTLGDLLDKDPNVINNFTGGLFNINNGIFGNKKYKFKDPEDWIYYLEDMREIIAIIDPEYEKYLLKSGSVKYRLLEEFLEEKYMAPRI